MTAGVTHPAAHLNVDFDTQPDLHPDHDEHHAEAKVTTAMLRQ